MRIDDPRIVKLSVLRYSSRKAANAGSCVALLELRSVSARAASRNPALVSVCVGAVLGVAATPAPAPAPSLSPDGVIDGTVHQTYNSDDKMSHCNIFIANSVERTC